MNRIAEQSLYSLHELAKEAETETRRRLLNACASSLESQITDLERQRDALLAAARGFVNLDDGDEPFCWDHTLEFDAARTAIAKVEGRP